MLLAVFQEFAHPEVLEEVKAQHICDIDVAAQPNSLATTEEEKKVVRTNAKLITVNHNITGLRDVFEFMSKEELLKLQEEVDVTLSKLVKLGFCVENRHPMTSTGCPMLDRVILSYPEEQK